MKAWLESGVCGIEQAGRDFCAKAREGASANDLVVLLASLLGG